jgi:hypothetical protein
MSKRRRPMYDEPGWKAPEPGTRITEGGVRWVWTGTVWVDESLAHRYGWRPPSGRARRRVRRSSRP